MTETIRFLTIPPDPAIVGQATAEGYTQRQAEMIGRRLPQDVMSAAGSVSRAVSPGLRALMPPDTLPDIDKAARRIADAIVNRETVLVATDHDADGVSSAVILYLGLTQHLGADASNVQILTTDRLVEGYGLSARFVARMLDGRQDKGLIITADQGSSDSVQIAAIRARKWGVIVTDHHLLPSSGPPAAALACVNPTRRDSTFDANIAGCHTAFLVLWATRLELLSRGVLSEQAPSLSALLQFSALGTAADAVSFARSLSNRAVAVAGVAGMNRATRPCWASLRKVALGDRESTQPITTTDIGWSFAPRINSAGRTGAATPGVNLLLATDTATADFWAQDLHTRNQERRDIQKDMVAEAMIQAQAQVDAGNRAISIVYDVGHPGIHGIVGSRVVAAYGRPVGCFSPKIGNPGVMSASFRSIQGFHMRDALERINTQILPGVCLAHGGHAGAAGSSQLTESIPAFINAFETVAAQTIAKDDVGPRVMIDEWLDEVPSLDLIDEIDAIGPFGREYETPVFAVDADVLEVRPMGDGTHARITVRSPGGATFQLVWFNARSIEEAGQPFDLPRRAHIAFGLGRNEFRGRTTVSAAVSAFRPVPDDEA